MSKIGTRGKWAESEVKKFLDKVRAARETFDFIKLKDARSSRGKGASKQVADFQLFTPQHHIALEVKEVEHAYRLPGKNVTQLPKMFRRSLAGGKAAFIVYFIPVKQWRIVSFEWMWERRHLPSYDFREVESFNDLEDCFKQVF